VDRINLSQEQGKLEGSFDKVMNCQVAKYVRNFLQGKELFLTFQGESFCVELNC